MYRLVYTNRAERDLRAAVKYIAAYDDQTARRWLAGFVEGLATLKQDAHVYGLAPESEQVAAEVRQYIYRTKSGRQNRALYLLRDHTVYILSIRRPGQKLLSKRQMSGLIRGVEESPGSADDPGG